jgi:thiol-disulfide isomerase/thioredoxin
MKTLRLFSRVLPLTLLLSASICAEFKADVVPTKAAAEHADVVQLKTKKELDDAISSNKALAIKVYTDWCGACTMMNKPYAEAAKKHAGKVGAFCLDADNPEFKEFLKMFDVTGYPMVLYIRKEASAPLSQQKYEPKQKTGSRIEYTCPAKEFIRKETGTRSQEDIEKSMALLLTNAKPTSFIETIEVTTEDEDDTPKKEALPVRETKRSRRSRRDNSEDTSTRRSRRRMKREGLPVRERAVRYYDDSDEE